MKTVLYHPKLGYYSKNERQGDYYTNADVHPIFSEILAQVFLKEWEQNLRNQKQLTLAELGCGEGKIAGRILKWISKHSPQCYETLNYVGIEASPARRALASKNLKAEFGNKTEILPEFDFPENSLTGIVFSNEFFDALPFHRVIKKKGRIHELCLDESFQEALVEPSRELQNYLNWLGYGPAENCKGEIHLESKKWMEKIGRALKKGMILTVDYGYEAEELYSDHRTEGTALCHRLHTTNRDFYENLGYQDITAHVNFTCLAQEAKRWGIRSTPLKTQSQFLLENGLESMISEVQSSPDDRARLKNSSAIKSLIHPEGLGGTFKVLIQRKYV